jgi:hypothetical protein
MKRAPLVTAHAESISVELLQHHLKHFRDVLGRKRGLYVLYKDESPFYIGLAASIRGRLADHLKDHLRGKWDRFSFFEIKKKKYLKDIESLLIRGANPPGNRVKPDFARHRNIKNSIKAEMKRRISAMFES